MELRQVFVVIRKWLWLMLLGTLVAATFSYLASQSMPRIYRTTTTVMVGQSLESANPDTQEIGTSMRLAQTYAQMVRRQPILRATIDTLGLDASVAELRQNVSVNLVQGTQLMEISVMDVDPQRAKIIADELARQLILGSPTATEQEREEHRRFVEGQLQDLQAKIEEGQLQVIDLQESLDNETSALEITNLQAQMSALEQKVTLWQGNYASLLEFFQESDVNYISIIEPAGVPGRPISPKTELNVLLAGTVGLIVSLGTAFLLEYVDDTVKTAEDAARVTSLSTLGAISQMPNNGRPEDTLVTITQPSSPISEAFRVLRTNLRFSSLKQPVSTLMVTSTSSVEGKSTTLANLGVVMAQAGQRVILVDTDLRRPYLHRLFGVPNAVGLTTMLLEDTLGLSDVLLDTEVAGLRLLTGGPIPPNPSELLELPRMEAIIEALCEQADVVLFDSPPVLAVADASVLATRLGGALLVVDAGRTRTDEFRKAFEALTRVGANLLGITLNRVTPNGSSSYYYYSSTSGRKGQRSKARRRDSGRARLGRGGMARGDRGVLAGSDAGGSGGRRRGMQWLLIALLVVFDLAAIAALVLLLVGGI